MRGYWTLAAILVLPSISYSNPQEINLFLQKSFENKMTSITPAKAEMTKEKSHKYEKPRPKGFLKNGHQAGWSFIISPVQGLTGGLYIGRRMGGWDKKNQPILEGPFDWKQVTLGILGGLIGLIVGIVLIPVRFAKYFACSFYDLFTGQG